MRCCLSPLADSTQVYMVETFHSSRNSTYSVLGLNFVLYFINETEVDRENLNDIIEKKFLNLISRRK